MTNPFDLMGMLEGSKDDIKTPFDMSTQVASTGGQGTLRGLIERLLPQRSQQAPTQPNLAVPQAQTQPQNPLAPDASLTPAQMDRSGVGHPAADTLSPVQKAFLNATSSGESGGKYNVRYSPRGPVTVADMSKHPGIMEAGPHGPSSAAGRYQFTKSTWNSLGGGSFDPVTQDIRAWQLADRDYYAKTRRDLKTDLEMEGFSPKIARALSGTWVSFKTGYRKNRDVFNKSLEQYSKSPLQDDNATTQQPLDPNGNPVRQILEKHQPMLDELIKKGLPKVAGMMDSLSRYGRPNIRGDQPTKEKLKRLERKMEAEQLNNDMSTDENVPLDRSNHVKIGDVVPLPITPGPNAGPTNKSADYGYGLKGEPGVVSIGVPTMSNWLRRAGERYRNK